MDYSFDPFRRFETPIAGPLKVYQSDRFVGTVPGYPVGSTSGIFDVRPNDFTPAMRDGERVLNAAWNIGPGDFRCIAGFREPSGSAPERGEMAETFDALAGSLGRTGAMSAAVRKALSDSDTRAKHGDKGTLGSASGE